MQWCVRLEMVWGVLILQKFKCPEPTLFKNVLKQLKNSIQPQMEQQWKTPVQINALAGQNSKCKSGMDIIQITKHVFFQVNIYLYCISELTGVPVALTTRWGHQYRCPSGWDRIKVATKSWYWHVPTSTGRCACYATAFWPVLPFHSGIFHLLLNNTLPIYRLIFFTLLIQC